MAPKCGSLPWDAGDLAGLLGSGGVVVHLGFGVGVSASHCYFRLSLNKHAECVLSCWVPGSNYAYKSNQCGHTTLHTTTWPRRSLQLSAVAETSSRVWGGRVGALAPKKFFCCPPKSWNLDGMVGDSGVLTHCILELNVGWVSLWLWQHRHS